MGLKGQGHRVTKYKKDIEGVRVAGVSFYRARPLVSSVWSTTSRLNFLIVKRFDGKWKHVTWVACSDGECVVI